jgi:hypothetical protein
MSLAWKQLEWFDHTAFCTAKVRNVSRLGSQIPKPQTGFELVPAGPAALGLRLRNLHDPIVPFVRGGSGPHQHECLNDIGQGRSLFDKKDARAPAIRFKEVSEVAGHRPEIRSDKNPILLRGEGEHIRVGNSFQPGLMGRKKIDCRFTAEAPGDNRIVETGIRQKADHSSASPRSALLPHTLERHPDFGRRWMGCGERILFALALHNVGFHILLISQVKCDRTVNLLQAQRRIM